MNKNRKRIPLRQELMNFGVLMFLAGSIAITISAFTVPVSSLTRVALIVQLFFLSCLAGLIKLRERTIWRRYCAIGSISSFFILFGIITFRIFRDLSRSFSFAEFESSPSLCRMLNSTTPEEDGVLIAARVLPFLGGLTWREGQGLTKALETEYDTVRSHFGQFPSTLPTSLLGLEGILCKTELRINSEVPHSKNRGTLIFLHGFGGNWSLLCSIMAEVASEFDITTVCPSAGPLGGWSSIQAKNTFKKMILSLVENGTGRIYLAGISAGAVGASNFSHEYREKITGTILLFGAGALPATPPLPTLLIYGSEDERFTPRIINQIIDIRRKQGDVNLEAIEITGDHLAIVKKKIEVQSIIRSWLSRN